jgi:hypothetical protein
MQQDIATTAYETQLTMPLLLLAGGVPCVQVYNGGKQWLAQDATKA